MLKTIEIKSFQLLHEVSFRHTAYLQHSAINADKNGKASIPYLNRILSANPDELYSELVDTYATIKSEHKQITDAHVTHPIADSFIIWGRMYVIAYFVSHNDLFWRKSVLPRMLSMQQRSVLQEEMKIAAAHIDEYYADQESFRKEMIASGISNLDDSTNKSQNDVTQKKPAIGRPAQQLFESAEIEQQQKEKVLAFLKKHNLSSQLINCEKDSKLNKYLASIYWRWMDLNLVPEEPLPTAYYKFLANVCELKFDVVQKSFTNRMGEILKHREKYQDLWGDVTEFFQK